MSSNNMSDRDNKTGRIVPRRPAGKKGSRAAVSRALKSAYKTTVEEDVPEDLLQLIAKLD